MSDYLDQICAFVCKSQFEDFPSIVMQRAKEVIADSLAVIAVGAQEQEVNSMRRRWLILGENQIATIIGTEIRAEPMKAALMNGMAGTFLELDEGNRFARGHPAMQVIPAALAQAEELNVSGSELLTALVIGYEIGARIAIASSLRNAMHPHGTWGTVGAAVAVGKLMKYDHYNMKEIINVSSSLTLATSRRTMLEGGTVRNLYAGVSGFMGILAHHLVQSGFTGEKDGLRSVFGEVVSESFDPEKMTKNLGKQFEIARNYFKQHACCRHCHPTLDALALIAKQFPGGQIQSDKIAKVEVRTYSMAAQLCDQNPRNAFASKFSIPFCIATYAVHGRAGVNSFKQESFSDPRIRALSGKVTVVEEAGLTSMVPDKRPARVKMFLIDGKVLEAEAFVTRGDAESPYSTEDKKAKYDDLVEPIWGHERAETIYSDIMALDKLVEIRQLTEKISCPT